VNARPGGDRQLDPAVDDFEDPQGERRFKEGAQPLGQSRRGSRGGRRRGSIRCRRGNVLGAIAVGAREEVHRKWSGQFSPTVSGGAWLSPRLKLRASVSRAFRVPSYTDLYYHDPANAGSPGLRPERAWSYESGVEYHPSQSVTAGATVFHRRERDGIDYVRRSPAELWRATNFQRLDFTGVEASVRLAPRRGQRIDFRYTGQRGAQDALPGLQSKYVFNYPAHSGVAAWTGRFGAVLVRTRVGVLDRRARDPYALWEAAAAWSRGRVRPFLQFANLGGARYQEVAGVDMPGRSMIGGVELVVFGRR